jgi:hypothetical protein
MQISPRQQLDETQSARFRHAIWLQIYLPFVLGASLVIALVALALVASRAGGATTSGMADVALVALLLPVMLLGVLLLAGIVVLAVGVARLIGWLPERARVVQEVVVRAPGLSEQIASRVVQVVVGPKSAWAAIGAAWARLVARD